MYALTNAQMREADAYTIRTSGVSALTLMERAGVALADTAGKILPIGRIVCVCGGGNNGGDGFVCARILKERGREVFVVCLAETFSEICEENRKKWLLHGEILRTIPDCELIVDCLFGTGFHGTLTGENAALVLAVNERKQNGTKILAADIPSGVCGENGLVQGVAVYADYTLCIGEYKIATTLGDGLDHAGKLLRADIGIKLPHDTYARYITPRVVCARLPKRCRNTNKGTYGRAAIVAGSEMFSGAAYLAARACLHAGCGYTTLFLPRTILPFYLLKTPEILLKPINDGGRYAFNEERLRELFAFDSVAIGMGMGISKDVADAVAYLLTQYRGKLILDADALNSLATYRGEDYDVLFAKKTCDVLITPHVKEFSRLIGKNVDEIVKSGLELPVRFAKMYGITVLLKSATSILTDGERVFLNVTGNSGLAKGGSGDVLSGVIAGLCACGASAFDGAILGAYLSGKAAELAAEKKSEYAMTATDVMDFLGAAFLSLNAPTTNLSIEGFLAEDTEQNGTQE